MTVTPDYLTGYEYGLLSTSGGANATSAIVGAMANAVIISSGQRNGTYAIRVSPGAAAAGNARVFCTQTATTRRVWRFGFKMTTMPASGSVNIFEVHLSTTLRGAVRISSAGLLEASGDGTTWQSGATISDANWHVLEVILDYTSATNTVLWRVDTVEQTSITAAQATTSPSIWTLGTVGAAGPAAVIDYDDVITGFCTTNSDWIGDGRIIAAIRPSGDGTHSMTANDFTFGDAGANITNATTTVSTVLDDTFPWTTTRSTTDTIRQAVLRTTSYCEVLSGTTPETDTANYVRGFLAYSSTGTTANTGACITRNSAGTAGVIWGDLPVAQGGNGGALQDYSESTQFFKAGIVPKPGAGWTPTEVNAIRFRIGGSGDVTPFPTWEALLVEVDYPPVAAAAAYMPTVMAPYQPA